MDEISDQNRRNVSKIMCTNVSRENQSNKLTSHPPQSTQQVLRQITKLATGEGIRYESKAYGWPEGCYFLRGTVVGPTDDIPKLMELGQDCEDEWGKDHGNGWLLSHPLKKLYQFQQYNLQD